MRVAQRVAQNGLEFGEPGHADPNPQVAAQHILEQQRGGGPPVGDDQGQIGEFLAQIVDLVRIKVSGASPVDVQDRAGHLDVLGEDRELQVAL